MSVLLPSGDMTAESLPARFARMAKGRMARGEIVSRGAP